MVLLFIECTFLLIDISKNYMTRSYYFQILPLLHPLRVTMLFTDTGKYFTYYQKTISIYLLFTDSFLLAIECSYKKCQEDIDYIARLQPILDLSNYPVTSSKYNIDNKGKLRFFKDELGGLQMTHFAGLRSKTYGYQMKKNKGVTKCKGIPKCARRKLTFDKFKQCLRNISQEQVSFLNIRSINHTIFTQNIRKRALCTFDE